MIAALNKHDHIAQLLIDHHAELDCTTRRGSTALIYAAQVGSMAILKMLIRWCKY